jgi:hypothetical protein
MGVIKFLVRALATLFAAFFGTLQVSMTGCALAPGAAWTRWLCHSHSVASSILLFAILFVFTVLVLSRRCVAWRVPIAAVLLVSYGIYGIIDAIEYQLWWLALVPVVALAAAAGIGLRARWGTLLTYAIAALFALYWSWGVVMAVRGGVFGSRPLLENALMLVPGIAFGLLAGFCCYVSAGVRLATIKRS